MTKIDIGDFDEAPPPNWTVDEDLWLVRPLRPNDTSADFWSGELNCHGFHCEGKVYTRTAKLARAFDLASAATSR